MPAKPSQENKKKPFLRIILPILASFLVGFGPVIVQIIITAATVSNVRFVRDGYVDLEDVDTARLKNRYLYGEVEFFYSQWIYSDVLEEPKSIPYSTPSPWTGKDDGKGGKFDGSGYASYRFYLRGLTPGSRVRAYQNIEIPNRIYLNGVLSSQTGQPSKSPQNSLISVASVYDASVVVPSSGIVEYVMEVGNTGDGGAHHLGFVYIEGTRAATFSSSIAFPISLGFMLASVAIGVASIRLSKVGVRPMLLIGGVFFEAVLYLCSMDSALISAGLLFSLPAAEVLAVASFGGLVALSLFYSYYGLNSTYDAAEMTSLLILDVLAVVGYTFAHGTPWVSVFLGVLVSVSVYSLIKDWVGIKRGIGEIQVLSMDSLLLAFGLMILAYSLDAFGVHFVVYPTISSLVISSVSLTIGFYNVYRASLIRKNDAMLQRRYKTASNRALAKFTTQEEAIRYLTYIGQKYESSLAEGDHELVLISSLMRKRLYALREESIPLSKECEIEGQVWEFVSGSNHFEAELVLDVDEGSFMVPPLIFEQALLEIGPYLSRDDVIFIEETPSGARLEFPFELQLQPSTARALQERCSLQGLIATIDALGVSIEKGEAQ